MKQLIFSAAFFLFANALSAQQQACPVIKVTASADENKEGAALSFTGNVSPGGDYTYNWSISDGVITSGQGTSSITVDSKGKAGGSITATVDVGGVNKNCTSTSSATVMVIANPKKGPEKKMKRSGKKN